MTDINVRQGTPISFITTLPEIFDFYDNVIIEVFTNENKRFKYSWKEKKGFVPILAGDTAYKGKMIIFGDFTAQMIGRVIFEIYPHKNKGLTNEIAIPERIETPFIITNLSSKNDH